MKRIEYSICAALFVILGLIVLAGEADAATVQEDVSVAERYWGTPVAGCERVTGHWLEPGGEIDPSVFGTAVSCDIWVSTATFSYDRCLLTIHEYGHLIGLEHSADRASIMFPVVGSQRIGLCAQQVRGEELARCKKGVRWPRSCRYQALHAEPWVYGGRG